MKEDKQEVNTGGELPDQQSAAPVGFPQNLTSNKPLSASQGSLRSVDNDNSSATMSADEAHPSESHSHREPQSKSQLCACHDKGCLVIINIILRFHNVEQ